MPDPIRVPVRARYAPLVQTDPHARKRSCSTDTHARYAPIRATDTRHEGSYKDPVRAVRAGLSHAASDRSLPARPAPRRKEGEAR
jgi:hypothetical protein